MDKESVISIRNATIASLVAGIILLVIPVLRNYTISFFSWLWSRIIWCWDAIFVYYSLPGWAFLIIFVFAFFGFVAIFLSIKGELKEPEFKSYVEDNIYQAKWRWKWTGNQVSNLWCYCPSCDATLVYNDSSNYSFTSYTKETQFICENCNEIITSIKGGNKTYAVGAVSREIERRIRTNEYKINRF